MKKYCLIENQKELNINIERKNIKNFNIRISPDCKINCSIPIKTTDEKIEEFLKDKSKWISKNIEKYTKLSKVTIKDVFKTGGSVKILGHQYYVSIIEAGISRIEFKELKINIYTKDICDTAYIEKQYKKFIKKEMEKVYYNIIDKLYPIIKKHKIEKPEIKIRQMKSCWGTCNTEKGCITLNEYLFKASPLCIEYVILHELTHFLYKFHNKDFYKFISVHMPDWQDRKNRLNIEFNVK